MIAWLEANEIEDLSCRRGVRVEQRANRRVVYERCSWVWNGRATSRTETHVVTIVTGPPLVTAPSRPDLHALLDEHQPSQFPLIDFGASVACG